MQDSTHAVKSCRILFHSLCLVNPHSHPIGSIVTDGLREDYWRKIASLTMYTPVKHFLSVLLHALRRARHFALVEGSAIPNAHLAQVPIQIGRASCRERV